MDKQTIGKQRLKEIIGDKSDEILKSFQDISPDFAKYFMVFV